MNDLVVFPAFFNLSLNLGCRYIFDLVLSFPLDNFPDIELLYCMAVLFLTFLVISILFSILVVPVCSPPDSSQEFPLVHTTLAFVISCFFVIVIPTCVRLSLIVVLICILLVTSSVEHLSCTYWPTIYFLWKWSSQVFCPFYLHFFVIELCEFFGYFGYYPLPGIWFAIFFPILYVNFSFVDGVSFCKDSLFD